MKKLQIQSVTKELLSTDDSKESIPVTPKKTLLYIQKLKLANTWIKQTENDTEEFKLTQNNKKKYISQE